MNGDYKSNSAKNGAFTATGDYFLNQRYLNHVLFSVFSYNWISWEQFIWRKDCSLTLASSWLWCLNFGVFLHNFVKAVNFVTLVLLILWKIDGVFQCTLTWGCPFDLDGKWWKSRWYEDYNFPDIGQKKEIVRLIWLRWFFKFIGNRNLMIRPKRLFLLRSGGGGDGNLFLCMHKSKPQNQLIQNANSTSFLPFKGKH